MKQLPGNTGAGAGWNNRLIGDLSYIRRHLHYRYRLDNMLPVILQSLVLLAIFGTLYSLMLHWGQPRKNGAFPYMIIGFMAIPMLANLRRYLQSLRFQQVHTPYFAAQNQAELQRFLEFHHFRVLRHPLAPEVFQIMSKNIDAFQEQREVVLFIADDRRILINSHFTRSQPWQFVSGARHHHELAVMLQRWLQAGGAPGSSVMHR